jgi:hypothetical protein
MSSISVPHSSPFQRMRPSQGMIQVRSNSLLRSYFERKRLHWGRCSFRCHSRYSFLCSSHLHCRSCYLRQKGRKCRMSSRPEPFLPGAGPVQLLDTYSSFILYFYLNPYPTKRKTSLFLYIFHCAKIVSKHQRLPSGFAPGQCSA